MIELQNHPNFEETVIFISLKRGERIMQTGQKLNELEIDIKLCIQNDPRLQN